MASTHRTTPSSTPPRVNTQGVPAKSPRRFLLSPSRQTSSSASNNDVTKPPQEVSATDCPNDLNVEVDSTENEQTSRAGTPSRIPRPISRRATASSIESNKSSIASSLPKPLPESPKPWARHRHRKASSTSSTPSIRSTAEEPSTPDTRVDSPVSRSPESTTNSPRLRRKKSRESLRPMSPEAKETSAAGQPRTSKDDFSVHLSQAPEVKDVHDVADEKGSNGQAVNGSNTTIEAEQAKVVSGLSYADAVKEDADNTIAQSKDPKDNPSLSADVDKEGAGGQGVSSAEAQIVPDVSFTHARSEDTGNKINQNEVAKVVLHGRYGHDQDARSEDSYPDLDEMTLDEKHAVPKNFAPYAGVRWAPWNVPAKRRLQTLLVLLHCLSIIGLVSIFFGFCANPLAWPLLLIYLLHILSSKAATDGSLRFRSEWFRHSPIWHLFAGYFPAKLHKTHNLPPTRKYIFGYHPHGIISHGAWAAFATEALGFAEKFPGITNSLLTLDSNFRIPFYRDYILSMGIRSVSKESIVNILTRGGANKEGMGRAVTIVIGGARESLEAQPGQLRLILKERKGFIKIAIRTGADLVPVLAFGENDLYDQLTPKEHPLVHRLQMFVLKVWKFTLPFLHGRGIFNYDVGLMPYRRPLNIVVGAPIKVAQSMRLDMDEVDRLHAQYVEELERLWDRYKDEFAGDRKEELQILK